MKFARIVFFLAGIWGVLILTPMYFMESEVARQSGPLTHPENYYGFIGVALAWQLLFLVLSRDPVRYRPMMLPAILEKLSFALSTLILYQLNRVTGTMAAIAGIDFIWAALFIVAFFKTASFKKAGDQSI